jgi:DNA-directed RNA polymerase specialized sigma24 family protein
LTITAWTNAHYRLLSEAMVRITSHHELSEELLHYTLMAFLDRPDTQEIVQSGGAFYFCLRIATNSWKSTTSPFYRLYRDPNPRQPLDTLPDLPDLETPEFGDETPDIHAQIDKELDKLSWYERELARAYAEHDCNANLLSKVTKIPRTSINLTLSRIRSHVKTNCSYE